MELQDDVLSVKQRYVGVSSVTPSGAVPPNHVCLLQLGPFQARQICVCNSSNFQVFA